MNATKTALAAVVLNLVVSATAHADLAAQVAGSWCFYEQTALGNTIAEKVDIEFGNDASYVWKEGFFEQKGSWNIADDRLEMSDVGSHRVLEMNANHMTLKRGSVMKFRRGNCDAKAFSGQDVTRFHNAASTGEDDVIRNYLERGFDINAVDWNRGDTALIKAAKFCQVPIAQQLLDNGADKEIKNEEGKKAIDYAGKSDFHNGCNAIVSLLRE